jgi:hypothetical protein
MPEYRAYLLNAIGRISDRIEFVQPDDETAIKACREQFTGGPFELWEGRRFVVRSEEGGPPSP